PGRLQKWSSRRPPEIRAVVQDAELLTVRLNHRGDEPTAEIEREWTSSTGALLVDLAQEGLPDGDYEVSLDDGRRVVQRSLLRLRSGATPDLSAESPVPLGHRWGHPLAVLTAAHT